MSSIFLDIDGVLNSTRSSAACRGMKYKSYTDRHLAELDPIAVNLIRKLVDKTNASIIISSSWRILYKEVQFFKELFNYFGWSNAPVVGLTPRTDSSFRGQEIQQYIDCDDFFSAPYVIFDDDGDFYEHQPLIRTNPEIGLSYDNYATALALLK